jgi:hypothetical protein
VGGVHRIAGQPAPYAGRPGTALAPRRLGLEAARRTTGWPPVHPDAAGADRTRARPVAVDRHWTGPAVTGSHGDPAGSFDHEGLAAYLLGAMSGLDAERAEEHLARCPACARELEHLVWISELLADDAAASGSGGAAAPRAGGGAAAGPAGATVGGAPGERLAGWEPRVPAHLRAGRVHPVRCH